MNDSSLPEDDILPQLGNTSPGLHEKVLELLANRSNGSILDVPAGEGRLSYHMKKAGYDVVAADIDEKGFKIPGIPCKRCDLNGELPFNAKTFNTIVCVEGIEHIENSFHLCRELARVLKDNGALIVSTPNILSIDSRLRFLFMGQFAFFGGYYGNKDNFYTYHINPAGFPQLKLALDKAGLVIEKMETNRPVTKGRSLFGGIVLLILSRIAVLMTNKKEPDPALKKALCSPELLMGENIILYCVKRSS